MSRPAWVGVAERAVAGAGASAAGSAATESGGVAAGGLARPFLDGVRERIADGVRERLPAGHADPGGIASAYAAALGPRLARIAALTVDFESDRAAAAGGGRFAASLSTPAGLAALFTRYPVLARLLATASMLSAEAGLELLTRFAADRQAIVGGLLSGTDPGPVVAVKPGLGDPHRGGRTVMSVSFADGRTVIYKPRTLAALEVFGRVIAWVNERVPGAGLRQPAAVLGAGYGWLEFVASEPLPRADAAAEFYWREGVLLAALYALHACDLHGENLIASGAVPVPVDIETIVHPSLPVARTTTADPAAEALADSVQRAALLPYLVVGEDGVSDRSGMGGQPGSRAGNRPRWDGAPVEATGYRGAILDGFRAGYDAIAAEATGFARLLEACAGLEVRTVVRPTSGYTRLLDASTRPDLMRDAALRDDALGVLRAASAGQPPWDQLAEHELADLWNGDVPLLTSAAVADIWTSAGQRLPGVLGQPVLPRALAKLAAMSEVDRSDQEWIIAASLATRLPAGGHRSARSAPGPLAAVAAEPGRLLAAACGLGDQIVARAAAGAEEGGGADGAGSSRVNWLGLQLVEDSQWMLLPMGAGLADGYLGVALFLAQLAELTGIGRYADVARRAVSALPELLGTLHDRPELVSAVGPGALGGLSGIGYGLARIGRLLGDTRIGFWGIAAAGLAAQAGPAASPWWAAGTAGCLAAITAVRADAGALAGPAGGAALARDCADRLSELVERTDGRCVSGTGPVPAGFAAGPAGVGWALTQYAAVTAEPGYRSAGRRAARCAVAAAAKGTRPHPAGAPGRRARCSPGPACRRRRPGSRAAAGILASRPVPGDLSLCHGELGIAEALTVAAEITGSEAVKHARRHRAGLILDMLGRYDTYCGTPGGLVTPGLLSGLAGIGYGLLRLGFAGRIPSVLLLEPAEQ